MTLFFFTYKPAMQLGTPCLSSRQHVKVKQRQDKLIFLLFQHGVGVEVIRLLPETHPTTISNVFCECDHRDDIVSKLLKPMIIVIADFLRRLRATATRHLPSR